MPPSPGRAARNCRRPPTASFVLQRRRLLVRRGDNTISGEPQANPLAVLITGEEAEGYARADASRSSAHGDLRTISDPRRGVRQGRLKIGSPYSPLQTPLDIEGTRNLGTQFTLALMAREDNKRLVRLFSAYDDYGPIQTTELVFDCDPTGKAVPGLRLICKGMEVVSKPVRFDDGKYHHLAVTYDQGDIVFYLDGVEAGKGRIAGGEPVALERNLRLGEDSQHANEQQFRGQMDDVLVCGRALKAQEIKALTPRREKFFKRTAK